MKTKILENKEQKKERLLAAAFHLMTKKNIQDISIAEVAGQAGIAKGTFYLYFKDKYDLRDFLVCVESHKILESSLRELYKNDIQNFEDAVIFLINQILITLQNNPLILNFIRHNLSWGVFQSQVEQTTQDSSFHLVELFEKRACKSGYVFGNPKAILFMILELTSSVSFNAILNQHPMPIEEIKPYLFSTIRAILKQGKEGGTV